MSTLCNNLDVQYFLQKQIFTNYDLFGSDPYKQICSEICQNIGTHPNTRLELNKFAIEAIKQLDKEAALLQRNGLCKDVGKSNAFGKALSGAGYMNSMAGLHMGFNQYNLYIDAKWNNGTATWHGANGKWYMSEVKNVREFTGNQFTGFRDKIIHDAHIYEGIGRKLFFVGATISLWQGVIAIKDRDYGAVAKAGADIIIGAIATFTGPVGWIIGGIYLFLDLSGAFDDSLNSGFVSPYSNPHRVDNTYYRKAFMHPEAHATYSQKNYFSQRIY